MAARSLHEATRSISTPSHGYSTALSSRVRTLVNTWVHRGTMLASPRTKRNRPVPSYPLPLFQNESTCETIHMKMSFTFTSIFMQIKVIFISMVSHVDSF